MKYIDTFLNSITMYRLVLYCLRAITLCALILSFFGYIPFEPLELIISLIVLAVACWSANVFFAKLYKVPANKESYAITALILFLIISPPSSLIDVGMVFFAGVLAIASKYLLVIHKSHLFNPAAFGAFAIGLVGFANVSWWVGRPILTPLLAIAGFLIIRKIRRESLFFAFAASALTTTTLVSLFSGSTVSDALYSIIISGTMIFFGTVMLTEPQTMPQTKRLWIIYGILIGILFSIPLHLGSFYLTAELSLLLGNIFAFTLYPRFRVRLSLLLKTMLSPDIYEFDFAATEKMQFHPGQYMEWTLGHNAPDARGNRRYFTIASSPTEDAVKLGVRVASEKSSSFKNALLILGAGDSIFASQVAGDFILPKDKTAKLIFIAGGIGITPYRSMIKYLIDTNDTRDITLFYVAGNTQDFVYEDLFTEAHQKIGLKAVKVLSGAKIVPSDWSGETGYITADMLKKHVPDYIKNQVYLSGPNGMVTAYRQMLLKAGISPNNIKTDYFPGY